MKFHLAVGAALTVAAASSQAHATKCSLGYDSMAVVAPGLQVYNAFQISDNQDSPTSPLVQMGFAVLGSPSSTKSSIWYHDGTSAGFNDYKDLSPPSFTFPFYPRVRFSVLSSTDRIAAWEEKPTAPGLYSLSAELHYRCAACTITSERTFPFKDPWSKKATPGEVLDSRGGHHILIETGTGPELQISGGGVGLYGATLAWCDVSSSPFDCTNATVIDQSDTTHLVSPMFGSISDPSVALSPSGPTVSWGVINLTTKQFENRYARASAPSSFSTSIEGVGQHSSVDDTGCLVAFARPTAAPHVYDTCRGIAVPAPASPKAASNYYVQVASTGSSTSPTSFGLVYPYIDLGAQRLMVWDCTFTASLITPPGSWACTAKGPVMKSATAPADAPARGWGGEASGQQDVAIHRSRGASLLPLSFNGIAGTTVDDDFVAWSDGNNINTCSGW